jgi:hypothetical protein
MITLTEPRCQQLVNDATISTTFKYRKSSIKVTLHGRACQGDALEIYLDPVVPHIAAVILTAGNSMAVKMNNKSRKSWRRGRTSQVANNHFVADSP